MSRVDEEEICDGCGELEEDCTCADDSDDDYYEEEDDDEV